MNERQRPQLIAGIHWVRGEIEQSIARARGLIDHYAESGGDALQREVDVAAAFCQAPLLDKLLRGLRHRAVGGHHHHGGDAALCRVAVMALQWQAAPWHPSAR